MSGDARVVISSDAAAAAAAAAEHVARVLAEAAAARGTAHWATTGGSTPAAIYRVLTSPPLGRTVPWKAIQLWWGDDRYVPRDHPLSNVVPADEILIHRAALAGQSGTGESGVDVAAGREPAARIPIPNIHPMPMSEAIGEARGAAWAAARYEVELRAAELPQEAGWPVFDLVLLGMGPDGHVLSVFPGSETFDRSEWVLPVPAPTHIEPHVTRVTLNPHIVDVARAIVVVVNGEAKAETLAAVFGPQRDSRRWPAQLARRPGAAWFVDEAAASRLPQQAPRR